MGVDAARIAAEAAGPEELAVRGGREPAAEYRRKRLALLVVDVTAGPDRHASFLRDFRGFCAVAFLFCLLMLQK
jgi:hypothetical protein